MRAGRLLSAAATLTVGVMVGVKLATGSTGFAVMAIMAMAYLLFSCPPFALAVELEQLREAREAGKPWVEVRRRTMLLISPEPT